MRTIHGIALLAFLAPLGCTATLDLFYNDADGGRTPDQADAEAVVDSGTSGQDATVDGGTSNPDAAVDAGLEPFSFNVATPPRIVQGTTATIPISIVRNGTMVGDIQITVTGLPAGVTAAPLTILSGSSTGDLQVTVASGVPQGPLAGVTIQGHAVGASASASANLPLFVRGPAGSLDTTFATDGRFLIGSGGGSGVNSGANVVVSADDHIFAIVAFGSKIAPAVAGILRLTPDGELDTTYGDNGVVMMSDFTPSNGIGVLLPDGRILIGGGTDWGNSPAYGVVAADGQSSSVRFFPDNGGAPNGPLRAMAPAPDGGILMVFDVVDSTGAGTIGVTKVTNAGDFDRQFGSPPRGFTGIAVDSCSTSTGAVVRPNGNIVIVAAGSDCGMFSPKHFSFVQLDGTGVTDWSFGANGQVSIPGTSLRAPTLLADGRIVVADVNWPSTSKIRAFTEDGALDTTFGAGGELSFGTGGEGFISYSDSWGPDSLSVDNQNHLLVPGQFFINPVLDGVWRFTATGAPDTSFGTNGLATGPLPADWTDPSAGGNSVVARVQKDGRIILLSSVSAGARSSYPVVSRFWN